MFIRVDSNLPNCAKRLSCPRCQLDRGFDLPLVCAQDVESCVYSSSQRTEEDVFDVGVLLRKPCSRLFGLLDTLRGKRSIHETLRISLLQHDLSYIFPVHPLFSKLDKSFVVGGCFVSNNNNPNTSTRRTRRLS